jgi:histidine phosphotransfer protein HptB
MTEGGMIDWAQLDGLQQDMGDGFDELVEVFLDEMDAALSGLDGAASPARMAADMHFLKGSALNLGLSAFAACCAEAEGRAGRGEAVDPAAIRSAYAESRAAFLRGLSERRAA